MDLMIVKNLTSRDIAILKFINEFGFCELRHLLNHFSLRESNGYRILKRLCKYELVIHEMIFLRRPGVYRLSKEGATYTDLPRLENVPLIHYDHQLKVIDVFVKLSNQYPATHWISERRLLKDQTATDILNRQHIADGVLLFPDEKQVAIEVELSLKSRKRLEQIFKKYGTRFAIDEVWYFCWPPLIPTLKKLSEKRPYIRIHNLEEFLR